MDKKTTHSPLTGQPLPVLPGTSSLEVIFQKILLMFAYFAVFAMSVSLATLAWSATIFGKPPNPWVHSAIAVIVGLVTWYVWNKNKVDIENHKLGRQGERVVAHIFEGLRGYGYTPIHDVPCTGTTGGTFNIDHVLIGPKGVFAVETKTWRKNSNTRNSITWRNGILHVGENRYDTKVISQVCNNATWLQELLLRRIGKEYPVTPILTFPGWWVEENTREPLRDNLLVVNPKTIGPILGKMERVLSDDEIREISNSISGYVYEEAVRAEQG